MTALVDVALLLVLAGGITVVATRDPVRQAVALSVYGLLLTVLFVVVQAPDVALSQLTVGAVVTPLMVALAVARVRRDAGRRPPSRGR